MLFLRMIVSILIIGFSVMSALADDQDLAAASQNPVADMISLPLKNKFNFRAGSEDAFSYELEMQPVYPVHLGRFNLINRFILPIAYQEAPYPGMDDEFGLRNLTYQAFFSPAEAGGLIWGAGPALIIPTNTDDSLGNDKWAAGPALVVLKKSPNPGFLEFLPSISGVLPETAMLPTSTCLQCNTS